MQKYVSCDLEVNKSTIRALFPEALASDIKTDNLKIGDRKALLCFVNGSTDTESVIKIEKSLLDVGDGIKSCPDMKDFMERFVPYNDKKEEREIEKLTNALLSLMSLLFIDGFDSAIILDTKKYPSRGISEPEKNKTLRGPRDGFSESVYTKTSLIRRRIKSKDLVFEEFDIGKLTKTRVIMSYMRGKASDELVMRLRETL